MSANPPLLTVSGLSATFAKPSAWSTTVLPAIADISFSLSAGRVLALVGESGSGKSVTALSIMGMLHSPGRITGGRVVLDGVDLLKLSERDWRKVRGKDLALICQEPMTALNPVLRIGTQMRETLLAHERGLSRHVVWQRCCNALEEVGIVDPDVGMRAWPHAFSGGMLQRVCIAMAMLHRPKLIIADEPTTALDVTVQAQILALMARLTMSHGCALLWITHDLSVARALADDVAFMSNGRIVEYGNAREALTAPRHAYARQLLASDARLRQRPLAEGAAHG